MFIVLQLFVVVIGCLLLLWLLPIMIPVKIVGYYSYLQLLILLAINCHSVSQLFPSERRICL